MSATHTPETTTRLRGPDVGIPPRRVSFEHSPETPRYFYGGNATASLLFTVLSGAFPPGEQFFVDSVQAHRRYVHDPVLKAQVQGFVGQEAIHSREHDRLNELIREQGIDVDLAERATAISLKVLELLPARHRLVTTAFMEHFTALLAEELLTDDEFQSRGDQELLQLWLWHALEELEHKAVSFDVYERVGNRRIERILAIPVVAAALLPGLLACWVVLLAREGVLVRPADLAEGLRILFAPRRGFITRIGNRLGLFAIPGYHPSKHDTRALEQEWRDRLFGEDGTLVGMTQHLQRPPS